MAINTYPSLPYLQQDLIDQGTGVYPNKYADFIIGTNLVVNNTRVDLWEGPTGTYVFPAAAQQMQIVSSSASDTAAGTGLRTAHIHYLDGSYNTQVEIITLNGTTPVNTVATNIIRINGFHSTTVGSNGAPIGNISLTSVGGGTTYGYMLAGMNRARQGFFTVPSGKTGYISSFVASSSSPGGNHYSQITLRATCHDNVLLPGVFIAQAEVTLQNTGIVDNFPIVIKVPATSDVKISAVSDSVNANCIVSSYVKGWFE